MKPFESFLNSELENFIVYRKGLGYKEKLIRSRLVIFDKYVKKQADPSSIWNPDFYLDFRKEVGDKPSTANSTMSAVRCFFEYLKRKDPLLNNPLKDVPNLQRLPFVPFVFSPEQVDMLLDVICGRIRRHTQRIFLKDFSEYLVILLLARCGLRISEPLRLKLADYRPEEKTIYIEKTKFSKDRLIPIPLSVARQIDNYLSCRAALIEHDINPYLFIGGLQKRLGDQRIRVVFHSAVRQIGVDSPRRVIGDTTFGKPTPHSLRHFFAVYTLKSAIARKQSPQNVLPVLAAYMGHVKYQYTMEYLRVVDAESRTRLLNFADILRKKSCD